MMLSTNQFTKKSFNSVASSWSKTLTKSVNSFGQKRFNVSDNAWEGLNTSGNAYGVDSPFDGQDFGQGIFSGFDHFVFREKYNINH